MNRHKKQINIIIILFIGTFFNKIRHWHNLRTTWHSFAIYMVIPICYHRYRDKSCIENAGKKHSRLPPAFFIVQGGEKLRKKLRQILHSDKGEASYISTFVYILVVVVLIAFIINVFHVISVKQEMDLIADQVVKQIQLNGGTNSDTDALFNYLASELNEVDGLIYQVTCSGATNRIQLGTPFYVSVTGRCYLGGFWNFNLVPIGIRAQGSGVSEHYWK